MKVLNSIMAWALLVGTASLFVSIALQSEALGIMSGAVVLSTISVNTVVKQ